MSMTSKVNPILRAQILAVLQDGIKRTNSNLRGYILYRSDCRYSLRAIQEATQKLTDEGVLEATRQNGLTFYGIKPVAMVLTANQGLMSAATV